MANFSANKIVTNLSKYNLSDDEKQLLTRGLSFISTATRTPNNIDCQYQQL